MTKKSILTLSEYFEKKTFVIPEYQRGYKWGVPIDNSDAVSVLMDNLIDAFTTKKPEYFLQGVTVYEKDNKVILIDGQQRTVTLFLLLKYLGENKFRIEYKIRPKSETFLKEIAEINREEEIFSKTWNKDEKEKFQDIFYFKKAMRTIQCKINGAELDEKKFKSYIDSKVKLFSAILILKKEL